MGRGKKKINIRCNVENSLIDKREIGFYKTPDFVAKYMTSRLKSIALGNKVLDPCCGEEDLVNFFLDEGYCVKGIDIVKYKNNYRCDFEKNNFINYYSNLEGEEDFDIYIANPPYNCHEVSFIQENREALLKAFGDVGIHNMYSLFISAMIDMAKEGAVIGIICSDSFLTAKNHKNLRRKIINNCAIHEITLCPKRLFNSQGADVKTCIMLLQKNKKYQKGIKLNSRPETISHFKRILNNDNQKEYSLNDIILNNDKDNLEFIIECPEKIRNLFNNSRIGDYFKCITGISTGNDNKYLSKEKDDIFTIPFYKNPGKDKFYTEKILFLHKDYIEISKVDNNFKVRNKTLINKGGITCSSMGVIFSACKLPYNSTFGVNPNIICEESDSWWLLAYLNSSVIAYIVRSILIRGNMITSGYVSRIPMLNFTKDEKEKLTEISKEAYVNRKNNIDIEDNLKSIDYILYEKLNLNVQEIELIENFNKNIINKS